MKVALTGIDKKDKERIFLELLEVSRKRPISKFENFLFTLLYADKRKCDIELVYTKNLLEIIDADYTKSLSITQKFLYDFLIGDSIRFDKDGKPKDIVYTNKY